MSLANNDINGVCEWISRKISEARKQNYVIGLSGGIDSAVVATLCTRAVGKDRVFGIIMPIHSKSEDSTLAMKLARNLQIDIADIDVTSAFDRWHTDFLESPKIAAYLATGHLKNDSETLKLLKANSMARMRMMNLYGVAALCNGLVAGTTNKTEAMIGYFTKYGDGGVDIEPIADFYKTEVYEMADQLEEIPEGIKKRKPTAGLWDNQTDEDELGMTYAQIDSALARLNGSPRVAFQGFEEEIIIRAREMVLNNMHKAHMPPVFKRGGIS